MYNYKSICKRESACVFGIKIPNSIVPLKIKVHPFSSKDLLAVKGFPIDISQTYFRPITSPFKLYNVYKSIDQIIQRR